MLCEHLRVLDEAVAARGIRETSRGEAWSQNCREWAYYDCALDIAAIREVFHLNACVVHHEHFGTHDGQEEGLICTVHHDGIMGIHSRSPRRAEIPRFP